MAQIRVSAKASAATLDRFTLPSPALATDSVPEYQAVWRTQEGKPDNLSARGVDHLWTKMKANAPFRFHELIADITMHDLRHDFAHRARQSGWTLEEIAVYLGHQTNAGTPAIATTVRYTLPSRQQLKRQLKTLVG